ncbi:NAD(P)-dependent oxidoreductase [Paraburkholderia sediminicola]|uniref:NAD(P)-dependent oxidoreductase n=1 Tax=Paraburkholderia sediminicola TaxID=458836 RepID=UPI0038BD65CC
MTQNARRSEVSVFGLGAMGGTLARAMLAAGHAVTVWNRTKGRTDELVAAGALEAQAPSNAVEASPLLVMCTIDKVACETVLRMSEVSGLLTNKTVVNLSTGSSDDARRISEFVERQGGRYVDGGIMAYPRDIGKPGTTILYSGNEPGFSENRKVLQSMAGNAVFLGDDAGTASVVYLALYAYYFGAVTAFMEGAALAEKAAVAPEAFRKLSGIVETMLADGLVDITRRLDEGDYSGDQATIDVHHAGQTAVRDAYIQDGIGYETTKAYMSYLEKAQREGNGDKDIAAMYSAVKTRN